MNLALSANTVWVGVGLIGQALFSGRFFVQWIASEKARKSIVPNAFWYLSIAGGLVLFTYACWRQDPVFIIGQGLGIFVYARNVYLLRVAQERVAE
jgi:lipid-A-disaccharide synthase-like uncharacterized protein